MSNNDIPIEDLNSTSGLVGVGPIPDLAPVGSFQEQGVRNLIDTKGYLAYHYRHCYSPDRASLPAGANVNSVESNRYGVMFYEIRQVRVVMQSLTMEHRLQSDSVYGFASAVVNVAGMYLDGAMERVYVRPRDLIVANPTITEQMTELVEYNPNGDTRLKHKVKGGVDYCASSTTRFEQGPDFEITPEGLVRFIGAVRPVPQQVLTFVYWFTPVWIVTRVPHTLRLIPSNTEGHGAYPRKLFYAPQQVIVVQNHLQDVAEQIDFSGLPIYSGYADTPNTTGGSI